MNNIIFKNICKSYGKVSVVKNLNLEINEGERLILLGPSGCGKTTTLRMIAGLESITDGELLMGGQVMNEVQPGERNIAMVFQSYALFPHLSVWDNVTFGLNLQNLPKETIKKRAEEALAILNLTGYEQRKPKELSGGQKQRVALCRALVKQSPYFLLDEPLSNLDAQLRQQARTELVKLHEIYKPTMIYVTHDQVEAMTVAHRIAILNKGELQQIGTPNEIYNTPANVFVAKFIGMPPMNIIEGTITEHKIFFGAESVAIPAAYQTLLQGRTKIKVGIRPERVVLTDVPMLKASVPYVENLGNQRVLRLELANGEELYASTTDHKYDLAEIKGINFDWENLSFFDAETEINLAKEGVQ